MSHSAGSHASRLNLAAAVLMAAAIGWLTKEVRSVQGDIDRIHQQQQELSREQLAQNTRGQKLEDELTRARTETETLRRRWEEREERITDLERKAARRPRRVTPPLVASMMLSAGVRVGDVPVLSLPAAADFVELHFDLKDAVGYRSYRATLTTSSGAHLWTASGLSAVASEWGGKVVVKLPARLFGEDDYDLEMAGLDESGQARDLARHGFAVVRE